MPPPIAFAAAKFQEKHNVQLGVFSGATMSRYSVAAITNYVTSPKKCSRQSLKRSRKSSKEECHIPTINEYIAFLGDASQDVMPAPKKQMPVGEKDCVAEAGLKRLKAEYESTDVLIGQTERKLRVRSWIRQNQLRNARKLLAYC